MRRDFYQVLGVARTATPAEIRAAYAKLVRHHHPDKMGKLPGRLVDVQQAYRSLSDPRSRAEHDRAITEVEHLHAKRQRRVQRRLYGYDRRHPRQPLPRQGWRRRMMAVLVVATALIAGASLRLIG